VILSGHIAIVTPARRLAILAAMSDAEIVITFQSERDLWYVQRGDATAMVSAQDMVNEYHRWHRNGRHGQWRRNALAFCRKRLEERTIAASPSRNGNGNSG
jgi:hypothetical protein